MRIHKELRIGNILKLSDEICVVNSVHEYGNVRLTPLNRHALDWKYESFNLEQTPQLQPISLTEEILLKCGFEKNKGGISYDLGKLSLYCGDTILSGTYFNSWAILEFTPKYLHQLQNLYFALTGEELKIEI